MTKIDDRIAQINGIISTYGQVTIRQVYYRLLGVEPNINYRKVQYACNIGRRDGRISFNGIVDRSRPVYGSTLYGSVGSFWMMCLLILNWIIGMIVVLDLKFGQRKML